MDVLVLLVAVPAIHPVTVHHLRQVAVAVLLDVRQVARDHVVAVAHPVVQAHPSRRDVLPVQIHVVADVQHHVGVVAHPLVLAHQNHQDAQAAQTLAVVNVQRHVLIIAVRTVRMDAVPVAITVAKIVAIAPVVQRALAHALGVA